MALSSMCNSLCTIIVKVTGFVTSGLTRSLGDRIRSYPTLSVVSEFQYDSFYVVASSADMGGFEQLQEILTKYKWSLLRRNRIIAAPNREGHQQVGATAAAARALRRRQRHGRRHAPRCVATRAATGAGRGGDFERGRRVTVAAAEGGGDAAEAWRALLRRAAAARAVGRRATAGAGWPDALATVPTVWQGGAPRCRLRGRRGVPGTSGGIPPASVARRGGDSSRWRWRRRR